MNSLLFALLRALRGHVWLRLLAFAFILSSLGNGLTQVVVFGQLLRWHATPTTLTLAWLLATVPGFIGSLLGEKLCRIYPPLRVLILCELLGLLALALPLIGLRLHSLPLLLAVQSVESLLGGISWPALALTFKRGLREDELPAATAMENMIFASQVLLGTGLGVLLFERVSPEALLLIDAVSFMAACGLLWLALQRIAIRAEEKVFLAGTPLRWRNLSTQQKRSLLLLPSLAAVGAPAMALLPALAQQMQPENTAGLALPLLFSRSLGQLCGPMLLNSQRMPDYVQRNHLLLGCLGLFLLAYILMPIMTAFTAVLAAIFIAHLASNVVFALGTFSVLHQFTEDDVSSASAKAWRWQTLSATLTTSVTVMLIGQLSAAHTLWCVSFFALLLVGIVLFRYRN
ncbi:MFS transporter [Scandinavium sp. V105_16]|uniref:MFS transporter n=1 Tax=Scandinavium lactucae TaxID=3095028 RepID=A0AAJ2SAS0_9ENTR|nr:MULTISPECIES: MFS transporter [unclassified Scandinavium]MDX6020769.1 MFS transporter [Scandinavium sp. V105_16]MDX6033213.1 MFS transporter [Scandinavium sp. V105_12]